MTRIFALAGERRAALEPRVPVDVGGRNNNGHEPGAGAAAAATATGPEQRHGVPPYSSETNFDTNMVIILAALLCALICALGLNSIVRCALRCSRRMVFESAEDGAVRIANTGIKRRTLRSLPIFVYGGPGAPPLPGLCTDCPICLAEFIHGDKVRVLPKCNHGFHVKCVDTWLLSHSSCPTCRQCLLEISENVYTNNHSSSAGNSNNPGVEAAPPARQPQQEAPSDSSVPEISGATQA
uniref:TSA: Wollemia nobilis Ref_Wollemi_Transcript_10090_1462 transcribed RNA sequence n=1 Tax=Wollemia nobilis TaxID=56998 RepID=A0A0C9S704_9CONI